MYEYYTLEHSYETRAKEHEKRAQYWLEQGKPDYAAGSMRKAYKWRVKLREHDAFFNGLYPKPQIEQLLAEHTARAEAWMVAELEKRFYA